MDISKFRDVEIDGDIENPNVRRVKLIYRKHPNDDIQTDELLYDDVFLDKEIYFYDKKRFYDEDLSDIRNVGDYVNTSPLSRVEILVEFDGGLYVREDESGRSLDTGVKNVEGFLRRDYDVLEREVEGNYNVITKHRVIKEDYKDDITEIVNFYENQDEDFFTLSERDLVESAYTLIQECWNWSKLMTQVEINERIVDGLMLLHSEGKYAHEHDHYKIVGIEAKTDSDNYSRLYAQIDDYLSMVDEVWLVVESKEIPDDLPFYVGVVSHKNDMCGEILREPQTLKHDTSMSRLWQMMIQVFNKECGVNKKDTRKSREFFKAIENLKRKLIWNQLVEGYHQGYVDSYVELTDIEKTLLRVYHGNEVDDVTDNVYRQAVFDEYEGSDSHSHNSVENGGR